LWKNKIFSLVNKNKIFSPKLLINNSLIKILHFLLQLLHISNLNKIFLEKNFRSISYNKKFLKNSFISKNSLITLIKGFLYIRKTKNNFFVTISDYNGNTLVSWSGGNTGRIGTRQRSTVFSADSALYECCFLAKERGLQSVIVHIKSSLWFQQIKHCFDGLLASGLIVDSVVYWPIKAFGGCRPSKVWWV
jgi:ribosomal protein S11